LEDPQPLSIEFPVVQVFAMETWQRCPRTDRKLTASKGLPPSYGPCVSPTFSFYSDLAEQDSTLNGYSWRLGGKGSNIEMY
jgi:hypothetical protein